METKPTFDPGLTTKYVRPVNRTITRDGDFNVRRHGADLRDTHPYLFLVSLSWPAFTALVLAAFVAANLLFAGVYVAVGIAHLKGADSATPFRAFLDAFFFSTHTLTTVGYGSIYPSGIAANTVAAIEALIGLMGFAIATGIMFGRFSRPSARIGFSEHMLVAPYGDGYSLQFRMVNRRSNNLLDVSTRMTFITVEMAPDGKLQRNFKQLELERDQIFFFPLTWTVVHPITPSSPLAGKTAEELAALQGEVLIAVKAFDETFGQTVNARWSYRHDEFVWGARFTQAFDVDPDGSLRLEVNRVSGFEQVAPVERI
jgi:inward rectifier potassium channel